MLWERFCPLDWVDGSLRGSCACRRDSGLLLYAQQTFLEHFWQYAGRTGEARTTNCSANRPSGHSEGAGLHGCERWDRRDMRVYARYARCAYTALPKPSICSQPWGPAPSGWLCGAIRGAVGGPRFAKSTSKHSEMV